MFMFMGMGGAGGSGAFASPVYTWRTSTGAADVIPDPDDAGWTTVSTKFDDIAPTDPDGHTTWETVASGGVGQFANLFIRIDYGAAVPKSGYAFSANYETACTYSVYFSDDGTTWTLWDSDSLPVHLGANWEDVLASPGAGSHRYGGIHFQISESDTLLVGNYIET